MTGTKRGVRGTTHVILAVALWFMAIPMADADEPAYALEIPAQDLDGALKTFAVETDRQVLFAASDVKGHMSPAISGEYSTTQALALLLADTDLVYEVTQSDVLLVKPNRAVAIGEATDQGGDSDSKNPRPAPTLMAQNVSPVQTTSNDSEGTTETQEKESVVPLEEIIVIGTGTNIRGAENPTVPLLSFDREDIRLSGAATVEDFLRTVPQNFGSETQITSDSGNPFSSGANDLAQGTSVDLRGLGAGSTLTLLNGRRMTVSGTGTFVDVSVLPLGVIERVDVLTDGASAVYGSDAVGGVVNFITRRDYEGFDVSARYGTVTDGSMGDWGVGAAGGLQRSSGAIFGGIDYIESTPLETSERDFIEESVLNRGGTLGADTEKLSFAGGASQAIGHRITLFTDVLYSDRRAESGDNVNFNNASFINRSTQEALFSNTRADFELNDSILASLFVDFGETEVINEIDSGGGFAGTLELVNKQFLLEAQLSGILFQFPGGAVSFATGGLYRD